MWGRMSEAVKVMGWRVAACWWGVGGGGAVSTALAHAEEGDEVVVLGGGGEGMCPCPDVPWGHMSPAFSPQI